MDRRRFLSVTTGASAIGLLAGCTQSQGSDDDSTDETDADTSTTPSTTEMGTPTETETRTEMTTTTTESGTTTPAAGDRTRTGTRDGVEYAATVTGSECGDGAADNTVEDITFDEDAAEVVVTGTIDAATPCRVVDVGEIDYDESGGRVTVTVATTEPNDGPEVCQQCLGAIDYETTLSFGETFPNEASVVHDGQSGRRELASAGYGSESATVPPESPTTTDG